MRHHKVAGLNHINEIGLQLHQQPLYLFFNFKAGLCLFSKLIPRYILLIKKQKFTFLTDAYIKYQEKSCSVYKKQHAYT